ncbi:MAG: hypothetical protein M3R55_17170 [Acidobacteriota bacterium]|nr:hypothetical protein [Acidobacteriota bacterium]
MADTRDIGRLFHQLNNQLGIVLANAELLEARATDDPTRARAGQVVSSALDAMATAREIRDAAEAAGGGNARKSVPPNK